MTTDAAAADEAELAIPFGGKTVFLGGLFVLAVLLCCSGNRLPVVLAFGLSLVLQPAMRQLERLHLPRGIAALLIIVPLWRLRRSFATASAR